MVRTEHVVVTPPTAAAWLMLNHPRNRTISAQRVASLAAAMRAGQWRNTGEAVKFADPGHGIDGMDPASPVLLDGQHRLAAVVSAAVPVPMSVARGIPPDALVVLDSGRPRDIRARLEVAGTPLSTRQIACMVAIEKIRHLSQMTARQMNPDQVLALWAAWREHAEAAERILGYRDADGRPTRGAPVLGAIAACRPLDPDAIDALAARVHSGQCDARGDADPARSLRRRIAAASNGGSEQVRWRLTVDTLRACEAEMSGESLAKIYGSDAHPRILRRLQRAGLAPREDG